MNQIFYNIVAKHLAKESLPDEEQMLKTLINENEDAKKEYSDILYVWEEYNKSNKSFSVESGLNILDRKINRKVRRMQFVMRVAAVFVGIIMVSSILYLDYSNVTTVIAGKEVQKILLPDASKIYLNQNASLSYRKSIFFSFDRKVKLNGEAFFEVTKEQGQKFIVQTDNFNIQVLGTKFNVRTKSQNSEISLVEGSVQLFDFKEKDNAVLKMQPGDFVSYKSSDKKINKQIINPRVFTTWKEEKLILDNFSLKEIAYTINRRFGKTLIINNKELLKVHLNGSAPSDDLDVLLKALSEILDASVALKNDTIIIK